MDHDGAAAARGWRIGPWDLGLRVLAPVAALVAGVLTMVAFPEQVNYGLGLTAVMVAFAATPLAVFRPWLGVAGATFCAAVALREGEPPGPVLITWAALGAALAALLLAQSLGQARQRRIARTWPTAVARGPIARGGRSDLVVAAVLGLGGLAAAVAGLAPTLLHAGVPREQARVVSVDEDDWTARLSTADGREVDLPLDVLTPRPGDSITIRYDRGDGWVQWVEDTGTAGAWAFPATLGLGWCAAAASDRLRRDRALRRLTTVGGPVLDATAVSPSGRRAVTVGADGTALAVVPVAGWPPPRLDLAPGAMPDALAVYRPRPARVFGLTSLGTMPVLEVDGVLLPALVPARSARKGRARTLVPARESHAPAAPTAVRGAVTPADRRGEGVAVRMLRALARPGPGLIPAAVAVVVGVGVWFLLAGQPLDIRFVFGAFGAAAIGIAWTSLAIPPLQIVPGGLRVAGPLLSRGLPWSEITDLEVDDTGITLTTAAGRAWFPRRHVGTEPGPLLPGLTDVDATRSALRNARATPSLTVPGTRPSPTLAVGLLWAACFLVPALLAPHA